MGRVILLIVIMTMTILMIGMYDKCVDGNSDDSINVGNDSNDNDDGNNDTNTNEIDTRDDDNDPGGTTCLTLLV